MMTKREINKMETSLENNKEIKKEMESLSRYLWLRRQKDRKCDEAR